MRLSLPAWLRPAATSQVAARLAQGQSPWMDAVHLLWSSWVFVVPVFSPRGYDSTWLLCTVLSYPVFLLLYARMLLVPRGTLYRYAWAMGALSAALLPVYPAGISYFVFACLSLRPSTRDAMWRHFAMLVVMNVLYLGWAHWLGMRLQSLVWLPVSVLGMAGVGAVYSINERKDALLRLSQDEVRRLAATAERERIGRDLHDLLGHTLSLVALKSDLAARLIERDPQGARSEIDAVAQISRDAWRRCGARSPAFARPGWWPNWRRRGCCWTWTASCWNTTCRRWHCRRNTKPHWRWWCARRPPTCNGMRGPDTCA
jgi:two-component system, NarL family, sensor histidine kinase DesK